MARPKLSGSVGKRGKNRPADVVIVQDLLNVYILEGRLGDVPIIDEPGASEGSATEQAIRLFQSRVMKTPPTGLIRDSYDDTFVSLCLSPKDADEVRLVRMYIQRWLNGGPPHPRISPDLWTTALESLYEHCTHPRLQRYSMLTLVDFRVSRKCPRLWVIDLLKSYTHIHTHVAHGRGEESTGAEVVTNFLEPYASKPGAYVATVRDLVRAGQTEDHKKQGKTGPAVRLHGLDQSNTRAFQAGILFHGAHYVRPAEGHIGCSRGCFATSFKDNSLIVDLIHGGSFVYAYAGEKFQTAC